MLELPSVTLFCADCVDAARAERILDICTSKVKFGAVKFLTSLPTSYPHTVNIEPLKSLCDYSIFMLQRAVNYIDTPYMLTVQHDGYILNAEAWDDAWYQYDYIGPLFLQYHPITDLSVGSGGFSFRSKKLMQSVKSHTPFWGGSHDTERVQKQLGCYEDGVISFTLRKWLQAEGFKYAPPLVAAKFAQGGWPQGMSSSTPNDATYWCEKPFGFHGGWANINYETGLVSPPPFMPGV